MFIFSELRELGDGICRAVICFLCLGPVLALVGVGFLAATSVDTRSAQVSSFNAAASAWSNGGASAFAALPISLVGPAGGAGATLALALNSALDNYGADSGSLSLPNMTARWAASAFSGHPFPSTSFSSSATAPTTLQPGGSPLTVQLFKTATKSISCSSSDSTSTCSGRCNGYWTSTMPTTCTKYFKLSSICVVVDPATRTIDTAGGAGCAVLADTDFNTAAFAGGSAGTKSSLGMFGFSSSNSAFVGASDFSGVQVTVRASSDPFVTLLRASGGKLTLDLSTETKGTIGGALLAVGIVITAITCVSVPYANAP